ncbi:unnamed protein product [Closterium sp. NIES-54]
MHHNTSRHRLLARRIASWQWLLASSRRFSSVSSFTAAPTICMSTPSSCTTRINSNSTCCRFTAPTFPPSPPAPAATPSTATPSIPLRGTAAAPVRTGAEAAAAAPPPPSPSCRSACTSFSTRASTTRPAAAMLCPDPNGRSSSPPNTNSTSRIASTRVGAGACHSALRRIASSNTGSASPPSSPSWPCCVFSDPFSPSDAAAALTARRAAASAAAAAPVGANHLIEHYAVRQMRTCRCCLLLAPTLAALAAVAAAAPSAATNGATAGGGAAEENRGWVDRHHLPAG